jgi:hypothetical protein
MTATTGPYAWLPNGAWTHSSHLGCYTLGTSPSWGANDRLIGQQQKQSADVVRGWGCKGWLGGWWGPDWGSGGGVIWFGDWRGPHCSALLLFMPPGMHCCTSLAHQVCLKVKCVSASAM